MYKYYKVSSTINSYEYKRVYYVVAVFMFISRSRGGISAPEVFHYMNIFRLHNLSIKLYTLDVKISPNALHLHMTHANVMFCHGNTMFWTPPQK